MGFRTEVEPAGAGWRCERSAERAMRENAMQTERLRAGLPRHRELIRKIVEHGLQAGMSASPMPSIELLESAEPWPPAPALRRPTPSRTSCRSCASEFAAAAACCPILFTKEAATGAFYAGAMFGFKPGESFCSMSVRDRGGFNPLILQREGFFISGEHIAIDRDHARFSERRASRCSMRRGSPSTRLRQIQRTLGQMHAGLEQTNALHPGARWS